MSIAVKLPSANRIIISNVSWETYESLLKDLEDQSSPRLAYDQGVLEIMSPHLEHDSAKEILAYIVTMTLEEMDRDFLAAGSTTYKREVLKRGFEPDSSFYIKHAKRMRGNKRLDLEIDPPPDLLIEIDITHDSMDKFPLYAALGVSEVWRYDGSLEIWILKQGRYVRRPSSTAIPILDERFILDLMQSSINVNRPAWARQARTRIRERIQ